MYPEILRIGDFVISSYGLMLVIAFLSGNYLLRKDMISLGKDPVMADDLTFQAALGGILGAKLYYLIENISGGRAWENLSGLGNVISGIFTLNASMVASRIQNFGSGMVFLSVSRNSYHTTYKSAKKNHS
jgi:phosphatidylglycerol:prolipoprotein diacylglycerol transferase